MTAGVPADLLQSEGTSTQDSLRASASPVGSPRFAMRPCDLRSIQPPHGPSRLPSKRRANRELSSPCGGPSGSPSQSCNCPLHAGSNPDAASKINSLLNQSVSVVLFRSQISGARPSCKRIELELTRLPEAITVAPASPKRALWLRAATDAPPRTVAGRLPGIRNHFPRQALSIAALFGVLSEIGGPRKSISGRARRGFGTPIRRPLYRRYTISHCYVGAYDPRGWQAGSFPPRSGLTWPRRTRSRSRGAKRKCSREDGSSATIASGRMAHQSCDSRRQRRSNRFPDVPPDSLLELFRERVSWHLDMCGVATEWSQGRDLRIRGEIS